MIYFGAAITDFSSTAKPLLLLIALSNGLLPCISNLNTFSIEAPTSRIRAISPLINTMDLNPPQIAGGEPELRDYDGCVLEQNNVIFSLI
jgi:hypothetical protein